MSAKPSPPLSLTPADRLALEITPPVHTRTFAERLGIHPDTLRKWSVEGVIELVNIFGQKYVTAESALAFNRRVKAGEFSKDIRPPKGTNPRKRRDAAA